ncbi:phage tail assembly protein [Burkholderia cepacia]|uniref:phage tail assembly protein n=1 Tax=Burkholderia cepacia TaxID=292 RepID=UPI0026E00F45|nr:phage tail assembly protein [Burkholderia cepacia]MDO5940642.1 phage tail assembly protein [Burkholderia cepacia]
MEITLKHPFTNAAGQRIEKLTIRRAKRSDMKAAAKYSKDDGEQEDFLFAQITGLTLEDINQLDLADSKALIDTFRSMVDN